MLLLFATAFLNASESALVTFAKNRIDLPNSLPKSKVTRLLKLREQSESFSAGAKNASNLLKFLSAAILTVVFAPRLSSLLLFIPLSQVGLVILSAAVIALVASYVFLILGETVPRKLAVRDADKFVMKNSLLLKIMCVCLKPFSFLCASPTNLILRIFGFSGGSFKSSAAEDEILMMLEDGNESGTITEDTRRMIRGIFEFDDTAISNIMTHRTEMSAVEDTGDIAEAVNLAIETGHSRLPVYHEDFDDIIGIVYVKDLLKYVCTTVPEKFKLTDIMREALFVPRTKLCSELFSEMKDVKTQIAIVVDEYGGTEGIVTIEDLVEEIFGNIQDEYDNEEEEIQKLDENTFTVDGSTSIDELSELMDVEIPDGDYDTVSGLIIEKLGRIPHSGEHPCVEVCELKFTVAQVENRRIAKVLVARCPATPRENPNT